MRETLKSPYRLALDLGATSLGWAVFRLKSVCDTFIPTAIIRAGVRIFNSGRDPKTEISLAVKRREARLMRRRRDRSLKRKARLMDTLVEYGFFPKDETARKALERFNPYELRARGLDGALKPEEFARALFHINQRRGFKSNRKTDKPSADSGALKTAISNLRQQLDKDGNSGKARTVGELLWRRMQEGYGVRARYRETKIQTETGKNKIEKSYDLYIDRAMIEAEFDALWEKQAEFNPAVFNDKARGDLKDTLLHQRRLRPVLPGRCTLLPDEERAPLALPSQQQFRIYQEVNNLRLLDEYLRGKPLTLEQRDALAARLDETERVTFTGVRKLLRLSGDVSFNLEDIKRDRLKGNATSVLLGKTGFFGKEWHTFDARRQDEIVMRLLNEENETKLVKWLQEEFNLDEARAEKIANANLPDGYGRLSRKALDRILPELKKGVVDYSEAVQRAGFAHHSDLGVDFDYDEADIEKISERVDQKTGEIKTLVTFKHLPYYGKALHRHVAFGNGIPEDSEEKRYGKIANPTVHIGLNQIRVVVNELIKRYGHPAEVVVEIARELKQNYKQKQETQKRQTENQKRNERIRKEIATIQKISEDQVKRDDIQRWILWEELNPGNACDRRCPYSGTQISTAMLFSDQVEIEHILPFSKTFDDSLSNKTLSMRQANRVKNNRTPWQAKEDFEKQGWPYEDILRRASVMQKNKRYRFAEDGYKQWEGKDGNDFIARALTDTAYLSRIASQYLKLVCPQGTRVIPGRMTGMLRGKFGLDGSAKKKIPGVLGLIGEKNRNDHRHHAVDACVIGVTDQGMLQKFEKASASAQEKQLEKLVETMPLPWDTYHAHVKRAIGNIRVSHKPEHGYEGSFHEDTAYHPPHLDKENVWRTRGIGGNNPATKNADSKAVIPIAGKNPRYKPDDLGGGVFKGYVSGSNYCLEITRNDKNKWEGEVISRFRAYKIADKEGKARLQDPHLAQNGKPLVMRLMKDDAVHLEIDGEKKTMRVIKMQLPNRIELAAIHEANVDSRNRDKQDPFAYISKTAGTLQTAKARRVTISPAGELRDPGFKG
jgi:CRISPR-associated endonuclease Csn1